MLSLTPYQAHAQQAGYSEREKRDLGIFFVDDENSCGPSSGPIISGGVLDRILQTFALQESGGDIDVVSASNATGKYQYLNGTWEGVTKKYPPAQQYTRAMDAPEEIQDAVAYFEYAEKSKTYGLDPFKLAVSHFYPAALTDESKMDIIPTNNKLTPRQYGEKFVESYEANEGASIPLKYAQAPEFDKYLKELGLESVAANTAGPGLNSAVAGQAVIGLDPGHGAAIPEYTDSVTGLIDRETLNSPETENMQEVANLAKGELEQAGYRVVLVKNKANASVTKRERVDMVKSAGAHLAVSLHSDAARSYSQWAEVWPQFVGGYRQLKDNPSVKVTFENKEIADLSDKYADIITEERDKAERGGSGITKKVVGQSSSFGPARGLKSQGDLSLVQLWSDTVPWVYNEVGAEGGMTTDQKQKYANGIVNGVKRIFPDAKATGLPSSGGNGCGTINDGSAVTTALKYAWPEHRAAGTAEALTLKPEYKEAVISAQSRGQYVGGSSYPGVDCGGFVTRVMVDSGYDSAYNHNGKGGNTVYQLSWVRANWQLVGRGNNLTTADLRPGDVAFKVNSDGTNAGHTFMYVGDQPNFGDDIASASLDQRAPMAGEEEPLASNIEWYRKK